MYVAYKYPRNGEIHCKCEFCFSTSADAMLGMSGAGNSWWEGLCNTCLSQVVAWHKDTVVTEDKKVYDAIVFGEEKD